MVTDLKKKTEITPEIQGQVLKSARESLRITVVDLAKKACLSKKHITELEEGGFSSFYSPEHKVRVAKKVSLILGLEENKALVYPGSDLAKQESLRFDSDAGALDSQVTTKANPKVAAEIKNQDNAPASEEISNKPTALTKNTDLETSKKRTVSLENLSQSYSPEETSKKSFLKPALSILLILLIGGGLYATKDHILELINPKPLPIPTTIEVLPETEEKPGDGPVVVPATPAPSTTPTTTSSPPLPSEAACPKADATIAAASVFEPNKPGNFVFVQSKVKQTVCVSDASGKVTAISLDAGASHTFTGKAPFTVLSSGLNNLSMFFQGRPVRYSNEQARSIRLEEGKLMN